MMLLVDENVELAAELDAALATVAARAPARAISIDYTVGAVRRSVVCIDGRLRGPEARPDFATGCTRDILISLVCLDLHYNDGLPLEAGIVRHLPELARAGGAAADRPTIQDVLMRVSGLRDPRTSLERLRGLAWDEIAARIRTSSDAIPPGVAFNYNGIETRLLSTILERFSGRGIDDLINLRLRPAAGLEPLQSLRPGVRTDELLALAEALMGRKGEQFGPQVRAHVFSSGQSLTRALPMRPELHSQMAYTGAGFRYTDGLYGFNSQQAGHACALRCDPARGIAFAIGVEGPRQLRNFLANQMARFLGYQEMRQVGSPWTVGALNGLDACEVAGSYQGLIAGAEAVVRIEGEALSVRLNCEGAPLPGLEARLEDGGWISTDRADQLRWLEFFPTPDGQTVVLTDGDLPFFRPR